MKTTFQSISTKMRDMGWSITFDKETEMVVIVTPVSTVRMNAMGPLGVKKLNGNRRWCNADAKRFVNYVYTMYRSKFPRNVKKSNASRKNIAKRHQGVTQPVI